MKSRKLRIRLGLSRVYLFVSSTTTLRIWMKGR
jgi:hypothetical protein